MYLYENSKTRNYKNEDVFFLLRFSITGNPVGAPIGEISEIIGQKEVLTRLDNTVDYLKELKEEEVEVNETEAKKIDIKP